MFKNIFSKRASFPALLAVAAAFWFGSASAAVASTMSDIFCNAYNNAEPFGKVFEWVAYVAGAAAILQGTHHFRLHPDAPHNTPLYRPIMLWVGGACLLALPGFFATVVESIYTTTSGSGSSLQCTAGTTGGGGQGLEAMLSGFVGNIKAPLQSLVSLIAILSGTFFMVRGLMKASKYGFDPKTHSVHSILTHIGFGALIFAIGENLDMMMESVFGSNSIQGGSALSWAGLSAMTGGISPDFQNAVTAALTFVQLLGIIAFVRGWLIMKKVVEGGGNVTLAQGLTHIIGGVMCINIGGFLQMMDVTFGTGLL